MGGEDSIAGFDHVKLRERLKACAPLQKLYERVFFDDYNLAEACQKYDNFHDQTISRAFFKQVILQDVQGILRGNKQPGLGVSEFHRLMLVVPRTSLAQGETKKDVRILYQKLSDELNVTSFTFKTFRILQD